MKRNGIKIDNLIPDINGCSAVNRRRKDTGAPLQELSAARDATRKADMFHAFALVAKDDLQLRNKP